MEELDELTRYFAAAMESVDARRPIASNARTGAPYSPGIGPHTERATVQLVSEEMERQGSIQVEGFQLEVPYPDTPRNKCDLCIGVGPDWDWAVEIKMLRLMGDNGKPNDNILMHILSPYPEHRSALTDCTKLANAGFTGRTVLLIYGYEYAEWPMEPAIKSCEILADQYVALGSRNHSEVKQLVHPIHKSGRVFSWEIFAK